MKIAKDYGIDFYHERYNAFGEMRRLHVHTLSLIRHHTWFRPRIRTDTDKSYIYSANNIGDKTILISNSSLYRLYTLIQVATTSYIFLNTVHTFPRNMCTI
jgi:hypothetical protein